jgi:hypothetical protein
MQTYLFLLVCLCAGLLVSLSGRLRLQVERDPTPIVPQWTSTPLPATHPISATPQEETPDATVALNPLQSTRNHEGTQEIQQPSQNPLSTSLVAPIIEGIRDQEIGRWLPVQPYKQEKDKGLTTVRCINRGMQPKCFFRNFIVKENRFYVVGDKAGKEFTGMPNPIYPADGQVDPLWGHHRYRGHPITVLNSNPCTLVVDRPAVFLFRMSGHSTYHLWENNLGPFFSTLSDRFDGAISQEELKEFNTVNRLLVVFVDQKPREGPKAPHLLDQLLRTFTDVPLINASRIGLSPPTGVAEKASQFVCFKKAIVGISASHFPHEKLLYRMMDNIVGYSPPPPLPEQPNAIFISRNHHIVTRGRKISNEEEVVDALNRTLLKETGKPLRYVHMQDYTYQQQVQLSMQTNLMFSPHGGGSANCIWMRKGSVMVEFVAPVGKTLLSMYRSMCGKSGVKHLGFLADPDPLDEKLSPAELNNNPRLFSNMVIQPQMMVEQALKALNLYRESLAKYGAVKKGK